MRRNYGSVKGAGFSRAFERAAVASPDEREPITATVAAPPECNPRSGLSADHVWAEGAKVGDLCTCGKRKKFPRLSLSGEVIE